MKSHCIKILEEKTHPLVAEPNHPLYTKKYHIMVRRSIALALAQLTEPHFGA